MDGKLKTVAKVEMLLNFSVSHTLFSVIILNLESTIFSVWRKCWIHLFIRRIGREVGRHINWNDFMCMVHGACWCMPFAYMRYKFSQNVTTMSPFYWTKLDVSILMFLFTWHSKIVVMHRKASENTNNSPFNCITFFSLFVLSPPKYSTCTLMVDNV